MPRKTWKDGKISRSADGHAAWAAQIAAAEKTAFVDLHELIGQRYDALGAEKVNVLFADAHTHTSLAGAELSAEIVVTALRALPTNPLAGLLR